MNQTNGKEYFLAGRHTEEHYEIVKERLAGSSAYLTSFLFQRGANVYVFSYKKQGVTKHTFVDAGDDYYRHQILSILAENDVNPAAIERIIITHRHHDHCGLADLLARESKAKILVHANFRSFVEDEVTQKEQGWLGDFNPSRLKEHDILYLPQSAKNESISISGVDFLSLIEPIEIGERGRLLILACPQSTPTHSPDQMVVFYSVGSNPGIPEKKLDGLLPTDNILFSGDLWLMRGPLYHGDMRSSSRYSRYSFRQVSNLISGKGQLRREPREQDMKAKEALKLGFCLIRVKPGHGEEFIGSRIVPHGLLANRDLLLALGYSIDRDKSILRARHLIPRIVALREQAYTYFVKELLLWTELGYTPDDVSELLVRIYKEQSGGSPLVKPDRQERRERLKATLARLRDDESKPNELWQLAEMTLAKLKEVR